ncbi:MAG: LysR family transcriptional regulator [Polyangiaceae bacterium]
MNWDDLRFVLTLARLGSLVRAGKSLGVDHTTVGRRVDAAEAALGVRLFTRTPAGYVPTADAEHLLEPMRKVEESVLALERRAHPARDAVEGAVRVTSPETFGASYLAPKLAGLRSRHPGLSIELDPRGDVLDLGRREAEVAVRFFRSSAADLVVRRAGEVRYGLYASESYLAEHPVVSQKDLARHALLGVPEADAPESRWLARLAPGARLAFSSTLSLALLGAARAGAGVAVLPRYLGDPEPALRHLPMPHAPAEPIWLTVHRDLRRTPRIRAVLDYLVAALAADAGFLEGG